MFEAVFLLAGLIFVVVRKTAITGFARHARLRGRVLDLVERHTDGALRRPPDPPRTCRFPPAGAAGRSAAARKGAASNPIFR